MPPEIDGESTYYMSANRSKRSIAVDLKHPDGQRIVREMAAKADVLFHIPAQTMADDQAAGVSILPMGSLFETAEMIAFEMIILKLRRRLGETAETMRARHTNLE